MKMLSKSVNRRIGQAMHRYDMLADGDRVLIAVSGGVDSLVPAWLLKFWRRKAPINYEILAVYIDNGFDSRMGTKVEEQLQEIDVPCRIERTDFRERAAMAEGGKKNCRLAQRIST